MAASEKKSFSPIKILESLKKIEKGKKIRIAILSVLTIAVIAALAIFLNQKTYTVLYSGMDAADTGKVLTALSDMGVDARTQGRTLCSSRWNGRTKSAWSWPPRGIRPAASTITASMKAPRPRHHQRRKAGLLQIHVAIEPQGDDPQDGQDRRRRR